MLLAGDLGGTKTLLGLYEKADPRPTPIVRREFPTLQYDSLGAIVGEFMASLDRPARISAAAIGVAGPVRDQEVELTNVPWRTSAREIRDVLGADHVVLLNDVEAMAYSVEVLAANERVVLQAGEREPEGTGALISVGTGVGMAVLHRVGGRWRPVPSEGGHADFAARTEREIALVRALRPRFGRVEIEKVVAGPGLANVARFTHGGACPYFPEGLDPADEPAHITRAAYEGHCLACREALDMFVDALGAVTGNLALTAKATGGVFIGGGVPPKILDAIRAGRFMTSFLAKPPVEPLVQGMPVSVITLGDAGLLGAAVYANHL